MKKTAGQSWRGLTETDTDRPQQRQAGGWKENWGHWQSVGRDSGKGIGVGILNTWKSITNNLECNYAQQYTTNVITNNDL